MSKKSNLFKFVTLRNPQLLDEDRKEQGFVFHPELSTSTSSFSQLSATDPYGDLIVKCDDFDPLRNKKALIDAFPEMFKFAFWLGKNKNILTVAGINKQVDACVSTFTDIFLDETELKLAWDNLVYQTVKNTNKLVREALIQIIIANKFVRDFKSGVKDLAVTEFDDALGKEYQRRASANVVIPKDFLPTVSREVTSTLKLSSVLTDRLGKDLETAMAQRRTIQYKNQLRKVKLEELDAHNTIKNTKDQYVTDAKQHRVDNLVAVVDTDGNETGEYTYGGYNVAEPEIVVETSETQLVDDTIRRAPSSSNFTSYVINP